MYLPIRALPVPIADAEPPPDEADIYARFPFVYLDTGEDEEWTPFLNAPVLADRYSQARALREANLPPDTPGHQWWV